LSLELQVGAVPGAPKAVPSDAFAWQIAAVGSSFSYAAISWLESSFMAQPLQLACSDPTALDLDPSRRPRQ
jgi:hypothetical protein